MRNPPYIVIRWFWTVLKGKNIFEGKHAVKVH